MTRSRSDAVFAKALNVLPGGVNSPVRAFKSVGGSPRVISSGKGALIRDTDGRSYIDYVMSYGPLLFGHAPDFVVDAITRAAQDGTVFGAPTEAEVELADLVCDMVPSIEMVRFVNSGTEATSSAVRLARGVTGRSKIIKCSGCFHGSVDSLLVAAGSGVATLALPDTAGVPASVAAETIVVNYNAPDELAEAFEKYGDEIAAFILEPVAANMGVVLPADGYLQRARDLTRKHGALLIFDEVISGFRLSAGGAQQLYNVMPDVTCLGKIVGGGVPCAAYGGARAVMEYLAPAGPVYQAGTLSGNPLAMKAGIAMLTEIQKQGDELYSGLEAKSELLAGGLTAVFEKLGVPATVQHIGSILTPFFTREPVTDYAAASSADTARFSRFFHGLLDNDVYIAPSQYEAWFVSSAHTSDHINATLEAVVKVVSRLAHS